MKFAKLLLVSAALAGCVHSKVLVGSFKSTKTEASQQTGSSSSFDAAKQCDVNSIATYKEQSIKDGTETDKTDLEKMHPFSARIDAGYRDMINACRAYAQCMDANKYNATACEPLERRWKESEKAFAALAGASSGGGRAQKPSPPPPSATEIGKPAPGFGNYGFSGAPQDP